jgi:hypothetical protein
MWRRRRRGLPERSRRAALTETGSSHDPCRRRAQSHATTRPPSNAAISRPSAPQKDHTAFLVSSTPPPNQIVLHRPVETAPVFGNFDAVVSDKALPASRNLDGKFDSICAICYATVFNEATVELVKDAEGKHECPRSPIERWNVERETARRRFGQSRTLDQD